MENSKDKNVRFNYVEYEAGRKVYSKNKQDFFRLDPKWEGSCTAHIAMDDANTPAHCESLTLREIIDRISTLGITEKRFRSCIQMFDSDRHFALKDYYGMDYWNGCIFVDIDVHHSDMDIDSNLTDTIYNVFYDHLGEFCDNFFYIEKSSSLKGLHALFYFDVEHNRDMFDMCAEYTKNVCYNVCEKYIGGNIREILSSKKVFDDVYNRPYQRCYITGTECKFLDCNGSVSIDELKALVRGAKKIYSGERVDKDGNITFSVKGKTDNKDKFLYHHNARYNLYTSIKAITSNEKEWRKVIVNEIIPRLEPYDGHDTQYFVDELDRFDYNALNIKFTSLNMLRDWGYKIEENKFVPKLIDDYKENVKVELKDGQNMNDVALPLVEDKINHIFAGCGIGKTFTARTLGTNIRSKMTWESIFADEQPKERVLGVDITHWDVFTMGVNVNWVCFISPMKSINKDSFEGNKDWIIIDSDHHDEIDKRIGSGERWFEGIISRRINVCTTWESFVRHGMAEIPFDYVIMDEIHTLYMYDYRIGSITEIKKVLPMSKATYKIVMSGTPSFETEDFKCKKIKVVKNAYKTPCEMVFYNKDYSGYIQEDIRGWIADPSHYALVFKDSANYKMQENFNCCGIECDVFNKNYSESVDYVLDNQAVRQQVTLFSVYGQAGINIYLGNTDKKAKCRIYVLCTNAMGIIQYANRVRDKERIDKVILPIKKDNMSNDIWSISHEIDIEDAHKRFDMLKETIDNKKFEMEFRESIIKLRYGFNVECVVNNQLDDDRYTTFKKIENVMNYEKQTQVIYNRLINADFTPTMTYLFADPKDINKTRMRSNQLAGQLATFDFDMFKRNKDGMYYLSPTPQFKKVMTGSLGSDLEYIFNTLYERNLKNVESVKESFGSFIRNIIARKGNIKKVDIENFRTCLEITSNINDYYDADFIGAMLNDELTDIQLATYYMRSQYNDTMDKKAWQSLARESYRKIHGLRKVVLEYADAFSSCLAHYDGGELVVQNDDMLVIIGGYLCDTFGDTHTGTAVVVDGVSYPSIAAAARSLGVNRDTIRRRMKQT